MSRSYKKHAVVSFACCSRKSMKLAKKMANRRIRRTNNEDIPNGKHFKLMDDRWTWPDDGKQRVDEERWPKALRK